MQLLGWNKDHVETAKKISCCLINIDGLNQVRSRSVIELR